MADRNFMELLENQFSLGKAVCVGLDSDFEKIPSFFNLKDLTGQVSTFETVVTFNRFVIGETKDLVCAYKPNIAFYGAYGLEGLSALHRTIEIIHELAPDVPVILDGKWGDTDNTNNAYVKMVFDWLQADAITVNPYMGGESLQPFLARKEKGIFVLCKTSNPGSRSFQNSDIAHNYDGPPYTTLYKTVAKTFMRDWNENGNCGFVVGATYPHELSEIREIVGDMPILIPGIGAQGGDLEATVKAGKNSLGAGMIINSSRGIIFSENPRDETEKLHEAINTFR